MSDNNRVSALEYEKSGGCYTLGFLFSLLGSGLIGIAFFAIQPGVKPLFQLFLLVVGVFILVVAKVNLDEGCAIDNRNKMRKLNRELYPEVWGERGAS